MGLLLSQRGPKATISLVYCMARAASMCKAGPTGSTGFADGLGPGWAADRAGDPCALAEAALSLEHPVPQRDRTRANAAVIRRHRLMRCAPSATDFEQTFPLAEIIRGTQSVYCMSWFLRFSARL